MEQRSTRDPWLLKGTALEVSIERPVASASNSSAFRNRQYWHWAEVQSVMTGSATCTFKLVYQKRGCSCSNEYSVMQNSMPVWIIYWVMVAPAEVEEVSRMRPYKIWWAKSASCLNIPLTWLLWVSLHHLSLPWGATHLAHHYTAMPAVRWPVKLKQLYAYLDCESLTIGKPPDAAILDPRDLLGKMNASTLWCSNALSTALAILWTSASWSAYTPKTSPLVWTACSNVLWPPGCLGSRKAWSY